MPRHIFTKEEQSKGGKKSALHPNRKEICSKGFWSCVEKHPFFARKHLKKIIKGKNNEKRT